MKGALSKVSCDQKNIILFLENRSDTNRLYQAMDVFVFPSVTEGIGLAAIEAQAASVPVITSTEVPDYVDMTPIIKRVSLHEGADYWARAVIEISSADDDNSEELLREKGFDIVEQAQLMTDYYPSLLRGK